MRRIRIDLEYDGSAYNGWQKQKNLPTVQKTVEEAIEQITKDKVNIHGASRTDTGVHALNQVVHVSLSTQIQDPILKKALNWHLPHDIVITDLKTTDDKFNAQSDATSKVYRYIIENRPVPSPLRRHICWWIPRPLNHQNMTRAARFLVGTHDFRAFETSGARRDSATRTIYSCDISKEGDLIVVIIHGNGFLKQMIRGIIGTLVLVGKGKIPPEKMQDILKSKDRREAGPNAPSKGLCLMQVKYEKNWAQKPLSP
ncbi:tRNA pseudouridine(38-40) synthase TruA [Bdellovibrionota bacterium]